MANTATETASQKAQREARELLHARLRKLAATPDGRAVLAWLMLDLGCLLSQSDMGEATHASARNAGRRDVAIDLLAELQAAAPADLRHLWTERLVTSPPETSR